MEATEGACFLDEEWESLYKIFSVDQDLDFAHLPGHNPNHFYQSNSTSDLSGSSNGSANYVNTQVFSAGEQISSLLPFDRFLVENGLLMGPLSDDHTPEIERPSIDQIDGPDDHKKRKCSDEQIETEEDEAPLPKKRARVSKHAEKEMQAKKKNELGGEEETINVQNSGCDASDNESNASQEVVKETLNINGKKRASRGAATDPQSLYARRRRERINERLRILQNLVPNGTKVDISTMLEEAVNYVKFLQLQIKLLSSDEMWMYAPLAYNGFDVGFYKKFSPYLQWP